jgi:Tol biopolymer transport system component
MPRSLVLLLLLLPLAGDVLADEARPVSPEQPGNAMNPLWSPDGLQLAYEVTHPQERYTELFLLDLHTGREHSIRPSLTSSGSGGSLGGRFFEGGEAKRQVNHEFAWSDRPGAAGLIHAYASSGNENEFDLFLSELRSPVGSTPKKEGGPSFSSDAKYLAYCSARTGDGDLYLLELDDLGSDPQRLTWGPGLDFYSTWAPSGDRLAYAALDENGADIRVIGDVRRPQQTDRALTDWKASSLKPSWAPDGRSLAFFSNHERTDRTKWDVYVVPYEGGSPRMVVEDVVPSERRGPAWTPDGSGLVVVLSDPNRGDPLVVASLADGAVVVLATGTVNNSDPAVFHDVAARRWRVAYISQGARSSGAQSWRRVWVLDLPDGAP